MATTREQTQAAGEAKLDELHERLTGAVDQLVSGPDWGRALAFAARFRARSFFNTLLIWAQHAAAYEAGRVPEPMPSYVAGYRQWQSLGRQVEKGQAGYMILAPVTGRFATTTPQDAQSWRRLGKGEKPRPGEVVRSKMITAKPAYVWDASQTAGEPIPKPPAPKLLEGEAPVGLWEGLAGLALRGMRSRRPRNRSRRDRVWCGSAPGGTRFSRMVRTGFSEDRDFRVESGEAGHTLDGLGDCEPGSALPAGY